MPTARSEGDTLAGDGWWVWGSRWGRQLAVGLGPDWVLGCGHPTSVLQSREQSPAQVSILEMGHLGSIYTTETGNQGFTSPGELV